MAQAAAWTSGKAVSEALEKAKLEAKDDEKEEDSVAGEADSQVGVSGGESGSEAGEAALEGLAACSSEPGGMPTESPLKRRRRSKGTAASASGDGAAVTPLGDGQRKVRDRNKNTIYQSMKAAGKIPKFVEQMIAKASKGNTTI